MAACKWRKSVARCGGGMRGVTPQVMASVAASWHQRVTPGIKAMAAYGGALMKNISMAYHSKQ